MNAMLWTAHFGHVEAMKFLVTNGANTRCCNRVMLNLLFVLTRYPDYRYLFTALSLQTENGYVNIYQIDVCLLAVATRSANGEP